jgi:hypothetical protein
LSFRSAAEESAFAFAVPAADLHSCFVIPAGNLHLPFADPAADLHSCLVIPQRSGGICICLCADPANAQQQP